jgi:hypothetical protein
MALIIMFVLAALVAIGAGVAINSPLLMAAGAVVGVIGIVMAMRRRRTG